VFRIRIGLRTTGLAGLDPDTDPSRPKLSPKRKKLKNFIFEEFSVELEASLECPLLGFKKTFMTVFIQIFFFVLKKIMVWIRIPGCSQSLDPDLAEWLGPDPDSVNADPKHCILVHSLKYVTKAGKLQNLRKHTSSCAICFIS
jgi:hypothetical protein